MRGQERVNKMREGRKGNTGLRKEMEGEAERFLRGVAQKRQVENLMKNKKGG